MNRMEIKIGNGLRLVAEQNVQPYEREMFIGIIDENDQWIQDLVIVRNEYEHVTKSVKDTEVKWNDNIFEVMVFGEEYNEDYTDLFKIPFAFAEEDEYETDD